MKNHILKITAILTLLGIGSFSCVQDFKEVGDSQDIATRSSSEIKAEVDFLYADNGGKDYFNVRKDRVIIKTNSEVDAKQICELPLFISAQNVNFTWVIAKIDSQKTDIEDLLRIPNVIDATYGLEYSDGTIQYPTDIIYAKAKEGASTEEAFSRAGVSENIKAMNLSNPHSKIHNVRVDAKLSNILKICRDLSESGSLESAAPSFFREIRPSNTHFTNQWSFKNTGQYGTPGVDIKAEQAWDITRGNPNIKIAVIDEGVDLGHPDLQANLLPGYDATRGAPGGANGSPYGDNAHGTACAGIVGAINNTIGVVGVASNCKIIPIRIAYDPDGWGWITNDTWVADGINHAWFTAQADVLSNSWGGGYPSPAITEAIHNAVTQGRGGNGSVVVFSTGNNNGAIIYPADLDDVIAVGAVSLNGQRKAPGAPDGERWGSNYGSELDVVAPGVLIPTTDIRAGAGYNPNTPIHLMIGGNKVSSDYADQNYTVWFNGTSAACPHVSGIAALILSKNPNLTKPEVVDIIQSTALGYPSWNSQTGYGLVNAFDALTKTISSIPPISGGTIAPEVQVIMPGETPELLTSTELASGGTGIFTYQWQSSSNGGSTWSGISNSSSPNSYQPPALTRTTYYRRKATDSNNEIAYSNVDTVKVTLVGGTIIPETQTIMIGETAEPLTVYNISGGSGAYRSDWQMSNDGTNWFNVSSSNGLVPTYDRTDWFYQTRYIRHKVSDRTTLEYAFSETAVVNVVLPLDGGTIAPETQTIVAGTIPAQLTSTEDASGGIGTPYYQWQSSIDGTNWSPIANATSATYQSQALTQTTYFRRQATAGTQTAYSNEVVVNVVIPQLTGGRIAPVKQSVLARNTPAKLTNEEDAAGGTGSYSYVWQSSSVGNNWTDIPKATAKNYQPPRLTENTLFRRKVTSGSQIEYSNTVVIMIK